MLRDKSLIPLSREHQHALAMCVQIDRALNKGAGDLEAWQAEIDDSYEREIRSHFEAEEAVVFPTALLHPELVPVVDELRHEHASLRGNFTRAKHRMMDLQELGSFAKLLSAHIRKEERYLFEVLQNLMPQQELAALGEALASRVGGQASCKIRQTPRVK